jgi:hypothetical protein
MLTPRANNLPEIRTRQYEKQNRGHHGGAA